jgi:hypothetical protein
MDSRILSLSRDERGLSAGNRGGAISAADGPAECRVVVERDATVGTQFLNNSGFSGAAIVGAMDVTGAVFRGNQSTLLAGAAHVTANSTFTDCRFESNQASAGSGGAVSVRGNPAATATFTRTTFTSNVAARGGAIDILNDGAVAFVATTATGNGTSTTNGRDIYNAGTLRLDSASTVGHVAGPGQVIRD